MDEDYKYLFKIILIGNSGVGKTCLIKRYTDQSYQPNYTSTIGVDFKIKTISVGGESVKLQIWDTAGQERFRTITNSYYRGAHGIIIVFDLTCQESFSSVPEWVEEIETHAHKDVEIVLIGNKQDLQDKIEVDDEAVNKFISEKLVNTMYLQASAKENNNVEKIFVDLAEKLVKKEKSKGPTFFGKKEAINLKKFDEGSKRFGCC
ncbi:Ras- protein Rab-30 [Binucleata daphniae]